MNFHFSVSGIVYLLFERFGSHLILIITNKIITSIFKNKAQENVSVN